MDSAHGQGRRQPTSSSQHRHDHNVDSRVAKDAKPTSPTEPYGANHGPKSGASLLSPWSNDSGTNFKLGEVVSRLGHQDSANATSRPKRQEDSTARKDRHKKGEDSAQSKQAHNDSSSHSKTSRGDVSRSKGKIDDKPSKDKKSEDRSHKQTDQQVSENSKASSQTPKNKRRARSSSRPRDAKVEAKHSSSVTQDLANVQEKDQSRRASIPVIWLSREDSKKHSEISQELDSSHTQKRRMSALSQAKLAFEKVAMAVTDTDTVMKKSREAPQTRHKEKGRKARSQSSPREIVSPNGDEKSSGKKKKSHTRHLSRDMDTPDRENDFLDESKDYSKSMQQLVPKQHRKTDAYKKQSRIEGEISLEGVSASQSSTSASSFRKSSVPFKLFQSIRRPSNPDPTSTLSSPQRQVTPSRPRKKFSRGHIDQDPLEVDYEVLDDRVASLESRKPISLLIESKRVLPSSDNHKVSAEEPLLSKHRELEIKLNSYSRESQTNKPAQRPSSVPYMQTFPRTKHQMVDPYSPTSDRNKSLRASGSAPTDRTRDFSPNQLNTPDSLFSSIHKIPSQTSFTSSDARSEVCLDLPDATDHPEGGLHLQDIEHDPHDLRVKVGFPNSPYHRIVHYTQSNIVLFVLSAILVFILSFILMWPLLVVIIFITPVVVLFKRLCGLFCCCGNTLCSRCCLCLCHTHLTSSELVWLGRATAGGSAVVQSLMVLQKGLDTDRIRSLIDARLLSIENRHGHRLYRRFTQKVVAFCCGHAWVTDHHFVVSRHVFNMPGYIETLDDLQQFISKMAGEPLSLNHPLWEIQILHNFREPRDTVLLFRMHACMTDGVSLVHVLENALGDSQKISHPKRSFSAEVSNTSPFKVLFSGPVTFLSKYLCVRPDFNLLHGRHVRPSGEMVVAWSEPFSLSAAMRVKQVARCTLSELLLSITAGNIRTYLQVHGISHPFNVKCAVPIDFQAMNGGTLDMENKYSMVIVQLPTNTEGAIPRLWQVKHTMGKFKSSAEAAIVNGARWLTYCLLPVPFFQRLWCKIYSQCTLLVANLAGPTSILKIDSKEVKCMMYWVPPLEKVPVTISFITYADQIRMAVISERSVIPNPDLLTRDFNHKLEVLSKLLAHRRIPGESSLPNKQENAHLLSNFTLDDLTAEQIQLEMSLVQQELHDLKVQLDSGPSYQISYNDTQLMSRIEALKERSRELMMHLRRRKADEAENAVILSEEDDLESEIGTDRHQRPFRRRTLSMSSKMSTASVSSTARPLSTASTSNLPSPIHAALPSWPEGDTVMEELDEAAMIKSGNIHTPRNFSKGGTGVVSSVSFTKELKDQGVMSSVSFTKESKGHYHSIVS